MLSSILSPHYRVLVANSGQKALQIAKELPKPDLILLDVMMPVMDGYQVFQELQNDQMTREIPVIFVTAMNDVVDEIKGLELGASDYITKPLHPSLVLARVHTQLALKRANQILHNQNAMLEEEVARRMEENNLTQFVAIRSLAHLAETRDPETGNHIERTQLYINALAKQLTTHPKFADYLTPYNIDHLTRSAPLHDIGKVGIPDSILLKPGSLTAEERKIMQTHANLGADAIRLTELEAKKPVPFMKVAMEIAHWHHEKWDGSGYPDGLGGDDIPISARLMALADVFDALISPRIYKPQMSTKEARDIIAAERSHHFDPDVTDAFLNHFDDFVEIAIRIGNGQLA